MATPPLTPNTATSRAGTSHEIVAVTMMMVLTFVTGVVDAVGYLGLDRVFTGNMTGNIVILGMGIAGADELPVLGPLIALIAFSVGAFAAGLLLRRSPKAWHRRTTTLLSAGGFVLLALGIAMFVTSDLTSTEQIVFAALTALVMGEQAAVARALAVRDMTTVVVTSTLTSLASESFVGHDASTWVSRIWNRRFGAIAIIFLGAVVGALLLLIHIGIALLLGGAVTLAVAALGHRYLTSRPH